MRNAMCLALGCILALSALVGCQSNETNPTMMSEMGTEQNPSLTTGQSNNDVGPAKDVEYLDWTNQ